MAGEVLVTVVLLVGPPWLATRLEWPLGPDTTWVWFLQYLRSGSIPDEVVLAFFVVFLWGVWAAHLVVVAWDIIAAVRGLVPRVGLVRLVWVLVAGGATATSAQTTAVAAHTTDAVAPAPTVTDTPPTQETPVAEGEQERPQDVFDRTSILAGFAFDSADLTPEMAESLEPTIGMIADFGHPGEPVVVTGHTDPIGDPFYNQGLSERRAQAVADHLADQLDADVEIQVVGKGAAQPPSHPRASYGEYRRVEISYTVQRPTPAPAAVPERSAGSEAETPSETGMPSESLSEVAPAPERVGSGAATAAEENTVLDLAGVGVVSGAVGAGVGYAVGRRRASATRRKPGTRCGVPTGPEHLSADPGADDDASGQDDLVRHDAEGLARGVVADDGYLLITDKLRVNSASGVALVGAHAARVLAALVADHIPGPVIATRAVAAALAEEGTPLGGVQVVSDLAQVRVAVETELLARARHQDEHGDEMSALPAPLPPVVVAVGTGDLDAGPGLPAGLTATCGVMLCVLGQAEDVAVTVDCDDNQQVRVRTRQGEVRRPGRLRLWSPPQGGEEPEGTPTDTAQPPSASDNTSETVEDGPNKGEEDQPEFPESSGQGPQEASDDHEPCPGTSHEHDHDHDSDTDPGKHETYEAEGEQPSSLANSGHGGQARVGVRLFVPQVVCEVNGHDVLQGTRTSTYTLLAALALGPAEGVSHQEVTQVLAPGVPESQARRFRANAVTALRKAVRDALELGNEVPIVENEKGRYRLQWEYFDIDVRQFYGLYAEARKAGRSQLESVLRKMVGLYRSDLLEDVQDEWFAERRWELQEIAADVYVRLLDFVDDGEERIRLIDSALRVDRSNEILHQEKMRHYASRGRKDAVHRCFQGLKDELHRSGSEPGPESFALFESLVRQCP
ncbi:hypothetical protein BJF83_20095 [Nocardiopsis sp. CNR-923]|nr:hypothetical protein BJF83_20095 [Nocardiopsis sp. CNR-923]